MDRSSHSRGTVECYGVGRVRVVGYKQINRAIDGDIVAVQLVEDESRIRVDDQLVSPDNEEDEETEQDNQTDSSSAIMDDKETDNGVKTIKMMGVRPQLAKGEKAGRVVGILKRNWKEYPGVLMPLNDSQSVFADWDGVESI